MTKFIIITFLIITAAFLVKCGSDSNLVYIYDSSENQVIAYFNPNIEGTRIHILSTQSKNVIGYFDKKAVGQKTFVIRKDGGDILYFTESVRKKSIVYIYDTKGFVWGYFSQY